MEPQFVSPNFESAPTPEQAPVLPTPETAPNVSSNPEAPLDTPEQGKAAEQLAVDHQGGAPLPAVPDPATTPVVVPSTDDQAQDATIVATTPASARDEDTIEKEWIAKVKSVISSTADDPHKQQSMASRLMADYVLKRYGRKIGEAGE